MPLGFIMNVKHVYMSGFLTRLWTTCEWRVWFRQTSISTKPTILEMLLIFFLIKEY